MTNILTEQDNPRDFSESAMRMALGMIDLNTGKLNADSEWALFLFQLFSMVMAEMRDVFNVTYDANQQAKELLARMEQVMANIDGQRSEMVTILQPFVDAVERIAREMESRKR